MPDIRCKIQQVTQAHANEALCDWGKPGFMRMLGLTVGKLLPYGATGHSVFPSFMPESTVQVSEKNPAASVFIFGVMPSWS